MYKMQYEFKPLYFHVKKKASPKIRFDFGISTFDYCFSSHGLSICLQINLFWTFYLCIKPFGALKLNK